MLESEGINNESMKQKLTLGIDKKVIEKAKAAGINISAITEQLLKATTYEPNEGNTRDDVVRAYQGLFEMARSQMWKYGCEEYQICVGGPALKVYLDMRYGLLLFDNTGIIMNANASVDQVLDFLYKPPTILEELIVCLTQYAEVNKEKLAELKFALRLVKALSDDEGEHKN